jgi:hypothetical protein
MAAGEAQLTEAQLTEAQLTDLLSGAVTGPGADQDGLTHELMTRFLAGLPLPAAEGLSEQAGELTEQGDERWSR